MGWPRRPFDTSYWSSVTQNFRNYTIWKYSIMKKDTSEQCVIMAVINCAKIELPVKCDINYTEILFKRYLNIGLYLSNETNGIYGLCSWWRHQMETFSALLAICAGNSPVPGEFPTQRPVTRSFDVYFDLRPNKWLGKQSWGWWFETLSCSLWRHRNVIMIKSWCARSHLSCVNVRFVYVL